ncbi:MAG: hypothetical protein H6707_12080 [Deltaproteobacteria bacterium]|nr:hypothetical protein [Deltaproteobacteria bacterium]
MGYALVYIEQQDGHVTDASLSALALTRELATARGATLVAVVPVAEKPHYDQDDIVAQLSTAGADRVAVVVDPQIATEPDNVELLARGVLAVSTRFPPLSLAMPHTAPERLLSTLCRALGGACKDGVTDTSVWTASAQLVVARVSAELTMRSSGDEEAEMLLIDLAAG